VVGRLGQSLIVNDSKATNVNSTLTALAAYEGRILLLLGGRPKQESMAPILKFKEKIARIITFGEAAAQVRRELSSLNVFEISHIQDLPSFLERSPVVEDTLLFSPACASFDQFKNFEDRGLQFKMIVKQLPGFK
jgi:UDP-N-acetylmuramoylalanine--D-glutamate ligase